MRKGKEEVNEKQRQRNFPGWVYLSLVLPLYGGETFRGIGHLGTLKMGSSGTFNPEACWRGCSQSAGCFYHKMKRCFMGEYKYSPGKLTLVFLEFLNNCYSSSIDYFKDPWSLLCFARYSVSSDSFF